MGSECACLGQDAIKAQALEKQQQNSKFFYYSDPSVLASFQEKLNQIQKNIGQNKRYRGQAGSGGSAQEQSRASRKHGGKTKSESPDFKNSQQQLRAIENQLQKENLAVIQNLQIERLSGWNEAVPSRLVLEVGQVTGLWSTSETWFTQCRSMIQVEYAGTCINSRPNANVHDPYFAELFIFPVSQESLKQLTEGMATKVFITVFTVEGKSEIPAAAEQDFKEVGGPSDRNVYKRIAEYCLDISEIRVDQMVHQLTLSLPVKSRQPQPGALFHTLRNCNISGLMNEESAHHLSFSESYTPISRQPQQRLPSMSSAQNRNRLSPPVNQGWYEPKTALLPVYGTAHNKNDDFSILDIMKEMEEPGDTNLRETKDLNKGNGSRQSRVGVFKKNTLLAPTPRGAQTRPHQRLSSYKQGSLQVATGAYAYDASQTGYRTVRESAAQQRIDEDAVTDAEFEHQCKLLMNSIGCKSMPRHYSGAKKNVGASVAPAAETIGSTQRTLRTQRTDRQANQEMQDEADDFSKQVKSVATTQESNSRANRHQRHKTAGSPEINTITTNRTNRGSPELGTYKNSHYQRLEVEPGPGQAKTTRRSQHFKTVDKRTSQYRKDGYAELEPTPVVQDTVTKGDSPVKAVRLQEALAKPVRSFSFDDDFVLDSDVSPAGGIDENWSPVAMGDARANIENRVSPLKQRYESQLLGGLHPVKTTLNHRWNQSTTTSNQNNINGVSPQKSNKVAPAPPARGKDPAETGVGQGLITAEEAAIAATSDFVKVSLRIQFLHNAHDQLISYREKLQKANDVMRQMDLNKQV